MASSLHDAVPFTGRPGHFLLESGYHGDLWLDLDTLFVEPRTLAASVDALAERLTPHRPEALCGPLLGGAFLAQRLALRMDLDFAWTERTAAAAADGLFQARYALPRALVGRLPGRRVALVDDVMSAGSSLRATHAALLACGAQPVVVAALLVLGERGSGFFAGIDLPVETLARRATTTWHPDDCPMCRAGMPLAAATGA